MKNNKEPINLTKQMAWLLCKLQMNSRKKLGFFKPKRSRRSVTNWQTDEITKKCGSFKSMRSRKSHQIGKQMNSRKKCGFFKPMGSRKNVSNWQTDDITKKNVEF